MTKTHYELLHHDKIPQFFGMTKIVFLSKLKEQECVLNCCNAILSNFNDLMVLRAGFDMLFIYNKI